MDKKEMIRFAKHVLSTFILEEYRGKSGICEQAYDVGKKGFEDTWDIDYEKEIRS